MLLLSRSKFIKLSSFMITSAYLSVATQSVAQTLESSPGSPQVHSSSSYPSPYYPTSPSFSPSSSYSYIEPNAYVPAQGPKYLHYKEGDTIPLGYYLDERVNRGLTISGSVIFGLFWGISVMGAAASQDQSKYWPLYFPVIGPLVMLSKLKYGENNVGDALFAPVCILDGISQIVGASLLIAGLLKKKKVLIRNDIANVSISVTPIASRAMRGIGMMGEF